MVLSLLLSGCNPWSTTPSTTEPPVGDAEQAGFADVVSAATDGLVSRNVKPRVRLVEEWITADAVGSHPPEGTLTLSPELDGVVSWADTRELVFEPASPIPPGTKVVGRLDLGKLDANQAGRVFRFDFEVMAQSYSTASTGIMAVEGGYVYEGNVRTADDADAAEVERLLTATQGGKAREVTWQHSGPRFHLYTVKGIERADTPSELSLAWNGEPIGVAESRTETVTIAARGVFAFQSARAVTEGEQYVELRFSELLDAKQKLAGLVSIQGKTGLRFAVDGSVLKIYASEPWEHGDQVVTVEKLKAADGRTLPDGVTATVTFGPIVPTVKFGSDGVILPSSANRVVPIEVTNVRAVEIEATRVYDSNLPQFLQVNSLEGSSELERVGKVVWRKRVPIPNAADNANRPVRLGLDVAELVQQDPNALYRLKLSFQRADIVYDCAASDWQPEVVEPKPIDDALVIDRPQGSYWDNWEGYDDDGGWWNWEERDDPCSRMFYRYGEHDSVSKNVMVSDVGLLVKVGQDRDVVVVANHIGTTEPLAAQIRVLDYQLQPLATGATDTSGFGRFAVSGRPFVVEALANGQRGFVRLDQGSALATSHFDTGGDAVEAGLKGYFYGERGVWRPGDDIFLTFVLLDETKKLPADHPVRFELVSPTGRIVQRRSIAPTADGFYDLRTRTATDAPTGTWTARVDLGGRVFTQALKVETIQPNRLKIGYEFADKVAKGPDPHLETIVTSRWLHGAKAPGLKVAMDVKLGARPTTFPKLSGYTFDDPTAHWQGELQTVFEGTLDADGRVPVNVSIPIADGAPGMLEAEVTTRVFEPSGAFSVDKTTLPVSPHARYVGVKVPKGDVARDMLLTDTKHRVDVVLVDGEGNPAGDGDVDLKLYKVDWRWWWEKGEENLADYAGAEGHTTVAEGSAHLEAGKGSWSFEVKYPDWGRYLLVATDRDGTHRTGRIMYIDWPGWAGRPAAANPGGATVLSVTTDKKRLDVGEEFHLTFPTPASGRALLSIESGSKVLSTQWVMPSGDTTTVPLVATADMAPSVYAHVTLLQPHGSTNDLPIRLYGVTPIEVEDPQSRLMPQIATAATWEPDSTATVRVSETSGRPMTYTLSVVDEGLLGLTRFQTPNAWSRFFGREALGVRTWDLYDLVAGAYGGALEGMLAIGGDGEGDGAAAQPQARRFPPMVRHLGPFTLAAGETASHDIDVPGYVGEVRVMVVAGKDGAYGNAEQQVAVKKPLMVLTTLPRVLGPGESISVPVDVFALEEGLKDVAVSLTVEGPVTISGKATRALSFASPGEKLATFAIATKDELGIARITATATSGSNTSTQTIEIQVRHPGVRQTDVTSEALTAGGTFRHTLAPKGIAGSNEATLEVSRVPPLELGRRLQELIRYPHGCVEQTTSSVFPQVFLPLVTDLTPEEKASVQKNVRAGIERLRSFQTGDGGFGYWPGDRDPNAWATSYVTHFLIEAERQGYVVPSTMRRAALSHLAAKANGWTRADESSDLEQSYRLYVLAAAGQPDLAAMNRLKEIGRSKVGQFRLAAAYQVAGQPETAKGLIGGQTTSVRDYRETGDTYGSALRDEALVLETLVALHDDQAMPLATRVSEALVADRWLSTQETAQALIALSRFATEYGTNGELAFDWSVGGTPTHVSSKKALIRVPVPAEAGTAVTVGGSQGPLFVRLVQSGLPRVGPQAASANGLTLEVGYTGPGDSFVQVGRLDQGTDLTVAVRVGNGTGRDLEELVLSQVVPSSWEIFGTAPGKGDGYDYRDVRDDRVYTYFDLKAGETRDFRMTVNAAYLGRTFLAPVAVEAMYDATISAHTAGEWVEVTGAGSE